MAFNSYERENEASPLYEAANTAIIAANAFISYDFEISSPNGFKKYLPFNFIQIANKSSYDVLLYVNGSTTGSKIVRAGTIEAIDRKTLPAINSYSIKNIGTGNIAIGELEVVAQRAPPDTDSIILSLHRKLSGVKKSAWVV